MNKSLKTEIIIEGLEDNPRCVHGPAVLFKDHIQGKERYFYSCSAYRDKKLCHFHLEKGEKVTQGKIFKWKEERRKFMEGKEDHALVHKPLKELKVSSSWRGAFCQDCGRIVEENHNKALEQNHQVTLINSTNFSAPSAIIKGKTENKREAQYFFTEKSKSYFLHCIRYLNTSHVICLGTPTVFDSLPQTIKKILLDIDHRYLGLYSPSEFIWFNMTNFHFFHEVKSSLQLAMFLSTATSLTVLLDPPFGARQELIQNTLDRLRDIAPATADFNVLWIFPYFMERKLQEVNKDLVMTKYRVNYLNHKEYSGKEDGRKFGSPVRIFTNVDLRRLPVPEDEGYRICSDCEHFVSHTDQHCHKCKTCPSKDGRPYVHCGQCDRCVKNSYSHCDSCDRCHLPRGQCPLGGGHPEDNERNFGKMVNQPGFQNRSVTKLSGNPLNLTPKALLSSGMKRKSHIKLDLQQAKRKKIDSNFRNHRKKNKKKHLSKR